jgi:hypothetical protein
LREQRHEAREALAATFAGALQPYAERFTADRLTVEAEAATGCSDWGGAQFGESAFRERLATLCRTLEAEAELSPQGRSRAHARLHVMLCSRLRYLAWRAQHPAASGPLLSPLIGTGLPRAGTTFLHNLLAQDPQNLSATAAEAAISVPPPGQSSEADEARAELYQQILVFQGYTAAEITSIHPFGADMPEECIFLQEGACSSLYSALFNVPSFAGAAAQALGDAYRWQIAQMQALQHDRPAARWVLKAPSHLSGWEMMALAFPDAKVFLNHRDPGKVIPSIASLFVKLRGLYSDAPQDLEALGRQMLAMWSNALDQVSRWRADHPDFRVVDIQYLDLIADPMATVEALYAAFELELSPSARGRMARFLDQDHHAKAPRRAYGLADYGLTEADIEASFGDYLARYGVAREPRG